MSDEEIKQGIESTDWMLPALKEQAERSKVDPLAREKFNEQAADWVIALIDEVALWREMKRSNERELEHLRRASEAWKKIKPALIQLLDLIKKGGDPVALSDEFLRMLDERENDAADGPIN
ncbi:MAG TPA: hypothetical protein VLJ61_05735 [Pyrinomonadaceae bacterium]|nr:hypothetical protein [Pyrinomonadaceae bacterium]